MAVIVLIAIYFVLRAIATTCTGSGCDVYIPISLLIPLTIFLVAAITGIVATVTARKDHTWFSVLLGVTMVGVAGPLIALAVFKDNPDAFLATATALEALVAVASFMYVPARARA